MVRRRDPGLALALRTRMAVTEIAEALGVSRAAVSQWRRVPEKHVALVARMTGISKPGAAAGPVPGRARGWRLNDRRVDPTGLSLAAEAHGPAVPCCARPTSRPFAAGWRGAKRASGSLRPTASTRPRSTGVGRRETWRHVE